MAIVKMDHVRLIAMTEDREEILRRLQRLGCVEIDQAVLPADQPQSGQAPPAETDSLSLLREQLSRPDHPSGWAPQGRSRIRPTTHCMS